MKKLFSTGIFVLSVLFFCSCTRMEVKGKLTRAGIALTFDDNSVDEWFTCMPLFDSFGVKATYYISNYQQLNKQQVQKLKILLRHGHEIAFHSTNHYNMVKYVNNVGMEKLMRNEIEIGLDRMHADNFHPVTFAYPYGQHNASLDNKLLEYFKSVRALNGTNNYTRSMATVSDNGILYGLGIDESSKRDMKVILQLVHNAFENNVCLVLVAHHIDRSDTKFSTSLTTLRRIIKEADDLGINFYTVKEISR